MTLHAIPPSICRAAAVTVLAALLLVGCAGQLSHMDGWYHLEAGEYAVGLKDLQQAMEADPSNTRFRADWLSKRDEVTQTLMLRAQRALVAQNVDSAREIYQTILGYDAANERARAGLDAIDTQLQARDLADQAAAALKRGDGAQALTLVNRALAITPDNAQAKAVKRELDERAARSLLTAPTLANLYKKPVTLEFRDANLKMIFDVLSRSSGINFILDRDVKSDQRTSIFLKQATLEDAVDMLAATNQLDKKVLNGSSVLIFPNTPAKEKEYQDLIVRAFYLRSAEAKTTAELVKNILKLKDVFVDDKLNMLVVRDTPDAIALADKLIGLYDIAEPEVMLEVEVLEIDRNRALNLGIQITDQFTISPFTTSSTNSVTGSTTVQPQSLNSLLHLNRDSISVNVPSATISADQQNGDADLLANPRIRVRNHEKAKILIGDKIPLVTTTTTSTGIVSENVQYQDVGMKLNVEPTIYPDDEVAIKVNLEVSSLGNQVQTKSGSIAYQIGTRTTETVLRLKDGETQVLAGLINNVERSSAQGLPGLTSLPIVGRLFGGHNDSHNKTEIVLSITPHLIRGIQRKDPAAEMFWSGTDAVLRGKPLQFAIVDVKADAAAAGIAPSGAAAMPATANATAPATGPAAAPAAAAPGSAAVAASGAPAAANNSPLTFTWHGPAKLKVGEEANVELHLDATAPLKGLPLQIAFNPKFVDVVGVVPGNYFDRDGNKGNLSQTVDKNGGRIAVALGGSKDAAAGSGTLLTLKVKALAVGESWLDIAGVTPIGAGTAVARPALPIQHALTVQP